MENKETLAIIAIGLTFLGYAPYFYDLIKGKIVPHAFSWLIGTVITAILYGLQVKAGAGMVSLITLSISIIAFIIFLLSLKHGNKYIKKIDVVFLVLALLCIPLWLLADQPVLSALLLVTIDVLGFIPTIRKSWSHPYSETLSFYSISIFRHALNVLAIQSMNFVTVIFPALWLVINILFSVMLIYRRRVKLKAHD